MYLRNNFKRLIWGFWLLLVFNFATYAQTISSVTPDAAAQGTTDLTVTFILDGGSTQMPPPDAPVEMATIGTIEGTSLTHNDTIVTGIFSIPFEEEVGPKDAAVTFVPPPDQGQPIVFLSQGIFTVTEMPDTAPVIITHPKSKSVRIGKSTSLSVVAYGSAPMSYQWQKNDVDIDGDTSSTYRINSFAESNAGSYSCTVSNVFGTATSDAAILTTNAASYKGTFPIVDTDQTTFFNNSTRISAPSEGEAFYGQDAQYSGNQPSYTDNGDGTVTDNVTGLMWQQSFDHNGDGSIDVGDKLSYTDLLAMVNAGYSFAGYDDWRLPSIKEQYSLILFSGRDVSGYEGTDTDGLTPFIDTDVFDYAYGDTDAGERIIDVQCASTTTSVGNGDDMVFGVNFADGRIKGYGTSMFGQPKKFNYLLVRGSTEYGVNSFSDNGDGTVTDAATGLMWTQDDNGEGVIWQDALSYAENSEFADHTDWRLPNVKELQSLVDYSRSPQSSSSAAIDPLFNCTQITNEAGEADYPFYWSSTTHANFTEENEGAWGAYVAFGRAMGYDPTWVDVHGAGAQRSDPKCGDPGIYPTGNGPQGDAIRIYNYVRLVRDAEIEANTGYNIIDTGQDACYNANGEEIDTPAAGEDFYGQDAQFESTPFSYDAADGIVTDLNTGLMWQQVPSSENFTWQEAVDYCENLEFGGYDDWRMPSAKELFSISNFSEGWPYLDLDYFNLASGEVTKDEQFWTSNYYVGTTVEGGSNAAFGVNHVTGHIKAYAAEAHGPVGGKFVRAVRGEEYGINDFTDNGDGTITDIATGLMWAQDDDSLTLDWQNALAYAEDSQLAGYSDWRLPDVKELQSIVDYSYSPTATVSENIGAAIDPIFSCTAIINEAGNDDYGYYWTNTSARFQSGNPYYYAWYVAFGMAVDGGGNDSHGAGAVRFDTKVEGGPLGEGGERYYNFVRLVRNVGNYTSVESSSFESSSLPSDYKLEQNYPNPFNPSTTIRFSMPESAKATLKIYNISGQLVQTLVDQQLSEGCHEFQWQAKNMSSGVYFYKLTSGSFSQIKRMILMK